MNLLQILGVAALGFLLTRKAQPRVFEVEAGKLYEFVIEFVPELTAQQQTLVTNALIVAGASASSIRVVSYPLVETTASAVFYRQRALASGQIAPVIPFGDVVANVLKVERVVESIPESPGVGGW